MMAEEIELMTPPRVAILRVLDERIRQEELRELGHFGFTCADPVTDAARLPVLIEEVGEVANAMLEGDPEKLLTEVVQVAAVAVAWAEALLAARDA